MEELQKEFPINFIFELRKRKEKTLIEVNQEDLIQKPEKILLMLKNERVDLRSWFHIIVKLTFKLHFSYSIIQ